MHLSVHASQDHIGIRHSVKHPFQPDAFPDNLVAAQRFVRLPTGRAQVLAARDRRRSFYMCANSRAQVSEVLLRALRS
jgi:hypothetical protein